MTDGQHKDDIAALIEIVGIFREEQDNAIRNIETVRKDVDRAQLTATFACLYGKRLSEHMGVNTQDVDRQIAERDPELARVLGISSAPPKHDSEAETDPFASP